MFTPFMWNFLFLSIAIFMVVLASLVTSTRSYNQENPYEGKRHVIIVETGSGINEKFIIHLRSKEIALRLGIEMKGIKRSYFSNDTFEYYVLDHDKWYGRMAFQYDFHKCNDMKEVMEEIRKKDSYVLNLAGGGAIALEDRITEKQLNIIKEQWDD